MTMPYERTRTIIQTRNFLQELRQDESLPENIRKEAHRLLRHLPEDHELDHFALLSPLLWTRVDHKDIQK